MGGAISIRYGENWRQELSQQQVNEKVRMLREREKVEFTEHIKIYLGL